ncbi:hypothetical protein W97_06684 [Coniosporium apollinis CBS 100218]|uniref:C2H2-type domain-containing protein n=1 Tax=Coniosporium apollinis (strain CBS 100218) TaxID=1168221 RepID=R7Z0H2_CONA1|nr:uncharacterized protein W97_06684 [Coniosporium apollinis CBS 100218]EON67431.1 hypothetical protein W97_06684 [Coniosporium apollinis CBS 100218]
MDSPGSPLSELSSDDFAEEVKPEYNRSLSVDTFHSHHMETARPAKRQKTGEHSLRRVSPAPNYDTDISEDTEGSVPASPNHPADEGDHPGGQITACQWEGCDAGDLGNMDILVEHLHDEHIQSRQKKYSCEWIACNRKGIPHASGYALRAHMRSHTREKPFYCTLPECDRSFTRSDALAKHMRTVHETEALRPSDPVPKHHSSNPTNKTQRLKLILNKAGGTASPSLGPTKESLPASPSSHGQHFPATTVALPNPTETDHAPVDTTVTYHPSSTGDGSWIPRFPPDVNLTPAEAALPAPQLFSLLRRQLHWATSESEELKAELEALERRRRQEWAAKELLVENMLEAERAFMARRHYDHVEGADAEGWSMEAMLDEDVRPARALELVTGTKRPWWRDGQPESPETGLRLRREKFVRGGELEDAELMRTALPSAPAAMERADRAEEEDTARILASLGAGGRTILGSV